MKIREFTGQRWLRLLGIGAITLYPLILYGQKDPGEAVRTHERIHAAQVRSHGWLRFYFSYLWQYARGRLGGLSHRDAYKAISFEAEAFAHQHDPDYPSTLLRAGPERIA